MKDSTEHVWERNMRDGGEKRSGGERIKKIEGEGEGAEAGRELRDNTG